MPNLFSNENSPTICIIGAGLSGVCAAIQLKNKLGLNSFTIFEKNPDVGGVWLVNNYPGCACDIQSHMYSYSFEKNPDWSLNYADQPEILQYIKSTALKHKIVSHIQFGTEVKSLVWDAVTTKWKVFFVSQNSNVQEERLFDIVINAPGSLRDPNIPTEFLSFKGPIVHSAQWDHTVKLDKTTNVAVIGSGSSAVQIIPAIANQVKELHAYQRETPWCWPRCQFEIPEFVKWIFSTFPVIMWMYRCFLFFVSDFQQNGLKKNNIVQLFGSRLCEFKRMAQVFGTQKTDLLSKLKPKYRFGCRRIAVTANYYPAFTLPNVFLHRQPIQKVESNAICTVDGEKTHIDVLILATGFKTSLFFSPMSITGINEENILHNWMTKGPRLYFGVVDSNTPNLFHLLGPHSVLGHNSLIFVLECQVDLMIKLIAEMMERNARKIAVKSDAVDSCMNEYQRNTNRMIWGTEKCGSWYVDSRGEITALWPTSASYFWMQTRKVDFSHFDFS